MKPSPGLNRKRSKVTKSIKQKNQRGTTTTVGVSNYFVFDLFGIQSHTLFPFEYLLTTRAQPNCFAKAFLPEPWPAVDKHQERYIPAPLLKI